MRSHNDGFSVQQAAIDSSARHTSSQPPEGLRSFLQVLQNEGHLIRVQEPVHWQFEIGKTTRECKVPLLFENVRGYPGQSVFTNGLRNRSVIALSLGMAPDTPWRHLVADIGRRLLNPLPPSIVESSDVFQNVFLGEDVDLRLLPVPHWAKVEVGRYLGTWHVNITQHPDTGARNVGVYRMGLLGTRTATVSTYPGSHLSNHVLRAELKNLTLPMAVAIGVPEPVIVAASAAVPEGRDEFEVCGALLKEPLPLIRCRTVPLEVPAESEIVIEGFIQPGVRVSDGPFFDFLGLPNTNPNAYLFTTTAVLFRNSPIFRGAAVGIPGGEDHQLFALLANLGLLDFHGSAARQRIYNLLLKQRRFRTFQRVGRLGAVLQTARSKWRLRDRHVEQIGRRTMGS